MAENGARESSIRRPTYRRLLGEVTLSSDKLEELRSRRHELDRDIQKYIAAKEREWKQFVKEKTKEHKQQSHHPEGERRLEFAKRRTSSESTQDSFASHSLSRRQQRGLLAASLRSNAGLAGGGDEELAVDDLEPLSAESRAVEAGLADRRASIERDTAFLGVFTPAFLPALAGDNTTSPALDRTVSDPSPGQSANEANNLDVAGEALRSNSDTALQAKPKRPVQLQIAAHRTSSSGSSVDTKPAGVLKSPTHSAPTKRKRVSIAVGDVIVAPTDSVPKALDRNSTSSHSWRSVPDADLEHEAEQRKTNVSLGTVQTASEKESAPSVLTPQTPISRTASAIANSDSTRSGPNVSQKSPTAPSRLLQEDEAPRKPHPKRVDADGDLFDLEDEDDTDQQPYPSRDDDDEEMSSITGRVTLKPPLPDSDPLDTGQGHPRDEDESHSATTGLPLASSPNVSYDNFEPGTPIDFKPGSHQQPSHPGFRRPTAQADPTYTGADYARAEHDAVVNDIYGSSYSRPGKGSFTGGCLGESYMARNAENVLRERERERQRAEVG